MFNLKKLQKKGMSKVTGTIEIVIGALIVVSIAVALIPDIFAGLGDKTGLGNATLNPDAPTWFATTLIVVASAGLLFMLWRVFDHKK